MATETARPTVGDRVLITQGDYKGQIGTVVKDDRDSIPFLVDLDGGNRLWCAAHRVEKVVEPLHPKVGDRVRVAFEAVVGRRNSVGDAFFVRMATHPERVYWVPASVCTVLPAEPAPDPVEPQPERSMTATEERLQALERGLAEEVRAHTAEEGSLLGRIAAQARELSQLRERFNKLERQMASLLSGANAARQVE